MSSLQPLSLLAGLSAAVAAATWGFDGVMHIANPTMFTIGMKS